MDQFFSALSKAQRNRIKFSNTWQRQLANSIIILLQNLRPCSFILATIALIFNQDMPSVILLLSILSNLKTVQVEPDSTLDQRSLNRLDRRSSQFF
jgi:hypothetical protein